MCISVCLYVDAKGKPLIFSVTTTHLVFCGRVSLPGLVVSDLSRPADRGLFFSSTGGY